MASQSSLSSVKVLIVGGGIVGLTLANALQHADIDYVLLESHDTVTPRVGATICIFPHGGRILDQLGCYDRLWENAVPLTIIHEHDQSGTLFRSEPSDVFEWLAKRTGYQTPFIDRHHILDVLYDSIKDKSKIVTGKRITRIEETEKDVVTICDDSTKFHGTLLAGADGVHSKVRDEMWRIADERMPGFIPAADKTAQRVEFRCLFGVAYPPFMAPPGSAYYTFREGISSATVFGKDGVVYFFLFDRLNRIYEHDEIPKYSDDDAQKFAESIADFPIQSEKEFAGKVIFKDLWQTRKSSALVATEEAQYEKWTFGRIALLGDSIHKGTPNAGPGGNGGIESAAAFANVLYCLRHQGHDPSRDQIITTLTEYERKRKHRASAYFDSARFFTDLNSLATWPHRLATWYMSDMWENASVEFWSDQCQNAPKIDYLPTPKRSLHGWMPFNEQQGVGMKEPLGDRLLRALVFVLLPCWALQTFCIWLQPSPSMETGDLDHLMSQAEFSVIHFIMLIESSRRLANAWTLTAFPTLVFILGQIYGMNISMPVYYTAHYVFSPIQLFRSSEVCLTDRKYSSVAWLAILLGYTVPPLLWWIGPIGLGAMHKDTWIYFPAAAPLLVNILWHLLARARQDTWRTDRSAAWPHADASLLVPSTFITCIPVFVCLVWLLNTDSTTSSEYIYCGGLRFLLLARSVYSSALLGGVFWQLLLRYDLVKAGMVPHWYSEGLSLSMGFLMGPGFIVGSWWISREHHLRFDRHCGAVIADTHEDFKRLCAAGEAQSVSKGGGDLGAREAGKDYVV